MENKKKPSILRLFQDHGDDFKGEGVLFTPEMLKWPFFGGADGEKEIVEYEYVNIHRKALEALTMISPFNASISMGVDLERKRLFLAYRTWGAIYLNGESVLSFSHDTREQNKPFRSLYEWTELDTKENKYLGQIEEIISLWTVEQWSDFFRKRILKKVNDLKIKAQAKRDDASSLEERADVLLSALAK